MAVATHTYTDQTLCMTHRQVQGRSVAAIERVPIQLQHLQCPRQARLVSCPPPFNTVLAPTYPHLLHGKGTSKDGLLQTSAQHNGIVLAISQWRVPVGVCHSTQSVSQSDTPLFFKFPATNKATQSLSLYVLDTIDGHWLLRCLAIACLAIIVTIISWLVRRCGRSRRWCRLSSWRIRRTGTTTGTRGCSSIRGCVTHGSDFVVCCVLRGNKMVGLKVNSKRMCESSLEGLRVDVMKKLRSMYTGRFLLGSFCFSAFISPLACWRHDTWRRCVDEPVSTTTATITVVTIVVIVAAFLHSRQAT